MLAKKQFPLPFGSPPQETSFPSHEMDRPETKPRLNSSGERNLSLIPMVPMHVLATSVQGICSYCSFNLNNYLMHISIDCPFNNLGNFFPALLLNLTFLYLKVKFFSIIFVRYFFKIKYIYIYLKKKTKIHCSSTLCSEQT